MEGYIIVFIASFIYLLLHFNWVFALIYSVWYIKYSGCKQFVQYCILYATIVPRWHSMF